VTTIGIIGAGQLGQMLGYAGQRLGLDFIFLDPSDNPPAASVGPVLKFPFDSEEGLAKLASAADVITYEFENVPVAALEKLGPDVSVYPPPSALENAQDRLVEKSMFCSLDIPTRRLGYDGKGQYVVREDSDIEPAVTALGGRGLIAEQWVPFDREVSAIGVRNVSGEIAHYPLSENEHCDGILSVSRAPAVADSLEVIANEYLDRILNHLDYVGVVALELFVTGDRLLANEFAPRVHNSGHWTIEGAETSQFENHLRAILDMKPGATAMRGFAGMLNLIGEIPGDRAPFETERCHLHDYGKAARPGRKLGHVTVVTSGSAEREKTLEILANHLNS
jgi:5-(carboxyamino)imidazole ribonucleotide synthase